MPKLLDTVLGLGCVVAIVAALRYWAMARAGLRESAPNPQQPSYPTPTGLPESLGHALAEGMAREAAAKAQAAAKAASRETAKAASIDAAEAKAKADAKKSPIAWFNSFRHRVSGKSTSD